MNDLEKKIAHVLLDTKAVTVRPNEPFTYASGIKSPIYCDNRNILGFSKERSQIVEGFMEIIDKDVDVIVGVATAGVPWGAIIADKLNKPFSYVRSSAKDHGAGKQIEGADVKGKKVAVIEDLISTGGSSLAALEAIRSAGANADSIYAIFTYEFKKAKASFEAAKCQLKTLSRFSVLIKELEDTGYLTKQEAEVALQWNESPETWGV